MMHHHHPAGPDRQTAAASRAVWAEARRTRIEDEDGEKVPSSERDKRLRAELAAELGWYPADLDDESIARQRADAARTKTEHDPAKKWVHLTELLRQRDVAVAGRAADGR